MGGIRIGNGECWRPAEEREAIERAVGAALEGRTGTWAISVHGSRCDRNTCLVLLTCPDGSLRVWCFAPESRDPAIIRATVEGDLGTAWMPAGWEFSGDSRDHKAIQTGGRALPR